MLEDIRLNAYDLKSDSPKWQYLLIRGVVRIQWGSIFKALNFISVHCKHSVMIEMSF